LVGRMFDEATVLRIADAFERNTEWSRQAPAI
jgi:Asp-tRNA(Asn)/Glu-tRNA(Gln) amidotransferase A subunit family amidase